MVFPIFYRFPRLARAIQIRSPFLQQSCCISSSQIRLEKVRSIFSVTFDFGLVVLVKSLSYHNHLLLESHFTFSCLARRIAWLEKTSFALLLLMLHWPIECTSELLNLYHLAVCGCLQVWQVSDLRTAYSLQDAGVVSHGMQPAGRRDMVYDWLNRVTETGLVRSV